jgi:hypothetical protein
VPRTGNRPLAAAIHHCEFLPGDARLAMLCASTIMKRLISSALLGASTATGCRRGHSRAAEAETSRRATTVRSVAHLKIGQGLRYGLTSAIGVAAASSTRDRASHLCAVALSSGTTSLVAAACAASAMRIRRTGSFGFEHFQSVRIV